MVDSGRLTIAVLLQAHPRWLGGVYYIVNLVNALEYLPEQEKPRVVVYYRPELLDHSREINYSYATMVPWHLPLSALYTKSLTRRYNALLDDLARRHDVNAIYPVSDPFMNPGYDISGVCVVSWYADLQHKVYPEYFHAKERLARDVRIWLMLKYADRLVVSSESVRQTFLKYYSLSDRLDVNILRFATVVDAEQLAVSRAVVDHYSLPDRYFVVANQFLPHKRHGVVFRAAERAFADGHKFAVVVTGRFENRRFPTYVDDLKAMLASIGSHVDIRFVGMVPRLELLSLMKHATAIVQPSIFEGWSTVIEDAKALDVPVIASDIPVHREQLGDKGWYFKPSSAPELARAMCSVSFGDRISYGDHTERIMSFARQFVQAVTA